MNKKAAIYIRVSTDVQFEEGYSVEAQKEQLTAYCVSRGIKDYDYYIDGGWSGSNIDRPEIQRLIKDVKDNKISHVIVYKLDRLSRSQKDTLHLIEDVFNPKDVAFVSLSETMDTSTPMGRLMLGILSAFAQLERENIKQRTRMGLKERVKGGYWKGGGNIPIGYDYDSQQGILVPNENAEMVRKVYELYIQGYGTQKIANMLGLKYGKRVVEILKSKSNYGVVTFDGEEFEGKHTPIVTKETYDEAMKKMAQRSSAKITDSDNILSGLIYCGKCGAKMQYKKGGARSRARIQCYSQQKTKSYLVKDSNCDQEKLWAEEVEKAVLSKVFLLKEDKSILMANDDSDSSVISTVEILKKQKSDLEKKIKNLYNIYATSDGNELLLETIKENQLELKRIVGLLEQTQDEFDKNINKEAFSSVLDSLCERWKYMNSREKKSIIRNIINKIEITDSTVKIQFKF